MRSPRRKKRLRWISFKTPHRKQTTTAFTTSGQRTRREYFLSLIHIYLLCKVRRKRAPRRVSYALRGELRRFDRYLAQHYFLLEHKITDSAAFCAYRAQT